jgi:hypothetical protein
MEATSGDPEVWHLISAEIDADGMTIDLRREEGRTLTMSFQITSTEALVMQQAFGDLVQLEIGRLGHLGVSIRLIVPNEGGRVAWILGGYVSDRSPHHTHDFFDLRLPVDDVPPVD